MRGVRRLAARAWFAGEALRSKAPVDNGAALFDIQH